MKAVYAAAVAAATLLAASAGSAQVVEMSSITCSDFTSRSPEQMADIMFWLEGYYSQDDDDTSLDFDKLKTTLHQLLAYCSSNPSATLLSAADEVMGGNDDNDDNGDNGDDDNGNDDNKNPY